MRSATVRSLVLATSLGVVGACSDASSSAATDAGPATSATTTASVVPDAAPTPQPCTFTFSNAIDDATSLAPDCAQVAVATTGPSKDDWVLTLKASSKAFATFRVSVDLGASPRTGELGAADVVAWDGLAFAKGDSNCTYAAGSDAVPQGAFVLNVDRLDPGANGASIAHGTLDMQLLVHAPSGADCGPQDVERVLVVF